MSIIGALQKQNRPVLVRVLTHRGPQYWAKELTETCIRHSRELYYTPRFVDLLLSMVLTNKGKISSSVNALFLHFGSTSKTPGLLPSSSVLWNDIVHDIVSHNVFRSKLIELKYKAAAAGEFEVVSHDETFKSLFSLVGQEKMSQAMGELHALHTFRGYTGCTFGVSAQRSTSKQCFKNAVASTFDQYLAERVKFVFSDAPMRIIEAARDVFKSLLAVGEDPLHLPIRLECCWGEKITQPSARVRQLHRKFRVASSTRDRFWQPEDNIDTANKWLPNTEIETRTPAEWSAFCKLPFNSDTGYSSYVAELVKISVTYTDYMQRTNGKGVSALVILKNGASRTHFEGLQNSSRLLARLGRKGARLGTGTMRNEQLHRELKSWMQNIYQSHRGRLQNGFRIFELAKLLTHSSAAYSPTLVQTSQQRLLFVIAGNLRNIRFFSSPTTHLGCLPKLPSLGRDTLQTASIGYDISSVLLRKKRKHANKLNWVKRKKTNLIGHSSNTNIFKRQRIKKK